MSAIGREQLKKADDFRKSRIEVVKKYNEAFKDCDFLTLPPDGEGNAWHLYLLQIKPEKLDCDRNTFAKELQEAGLGISMHFIAIFHFTYWKARYPDFTAENFPNAEKHYQNTITLPLYPYMTEEESDFVIEKVKETGKKHHA